jgi:peptidoglycan-associated lipoprotein
LHKYNIANSISLRLWQWETLEEELRMRLVEFGTRILALSISALVAACSTDQAKEPPKSEPALIAAPGPGTTAAPIARPVVAPVVPQNPLLDPANILSKRSVYYSYDKYDVTPEYRPLVDAHAKYLREHPGATVTVQGNCDERGSREYNIALGQRRAENVVKLMRLLGVPERQIEAISLGEEKPQAIGHDEVAWAKNRRSDIVYGRDK